MRTAPTPGAGGFPDAALATGEGIDLELDVGFDRTSPRPRSRSLRLVKRFAVGTLGGAIVGAGIVLLVLPGPGLLVVIAGLAVLATEFTWAERRLHQARERARQATSAVSRGRARRAGR